MLPFCLLLALFAVIESATNIKNLYCKDNDVYPPDAKFNRYICGINSLTFESGDRHQMIINGVADCKQIHTVFLFIRGETAKQKALLDIAIRVEADYCTNPTSRMEI